eukprot:862921-Pleurochrysis_carterae.AAC.2
MRILQTAAIRMKFVTAGPNMIASGRTRKRGLEQQSKCGREGGRRHKFACSYEREHTYCFCERGRGHGRGRGRKSDYQLRMHVWAIEETTARVRAESESGSSLFKIADTAA